VKFWINATVNGVQKMVIGNGCFDEKSYTIKARPVFNAGTGMFKTFSGNESINLSVSVTDMSGNNVTGATIEIQSVKYSMTGENVPLVESSSSFTTDANGEAIVTFDPTYIEIRLLQRQGQNDNTGRCD